MLLHIGAPTASFRLFETLPLPFKSPPLPNTQISFTRNNCCFSLPSSSTSSSSASSSTPISPAGAAARKRKRYRKPYPGETKGIVEEMRFVSMRLRNTSNSGDEKGEQGGDTWRPSIEGFLKYLVDSKLVFDTLERIMDESSHVAYAYFRKTGLERSASLSKDLEWFSQQGIAIPPPSPPGVTYATYLNEVAEKSAPSFLCHFYNINFAHISGGQGIGKQVCEQLFEGRELEFYKWEGHVPDLLKDVREKLNKVGEHWSRDEKNRCLSEAAKSFRFSGQIIRLIILL